VKLNKYQFSVYTFLLLAAINSAYGQPRVIKGTVWSKDGMKVAGVLVTAHKSKDKYYTSFDGFYQINANIKSKWIKFTFHDRVEKINIDGIKRDIIDYYWVKDFRQQTTDNKKKAAGNKH
jgi:hypothetical protein